MIYYNLSTDVDVQAADYSLQAMPGTVWVEMVPREERKGSLYLPDVIKNKQRLDVAVVVGSGVDELKVGDIVAVDWKLGTILQEFGWDERIARSETRVYGRTADGPYPWHRGITMKLENGTFKAVGKDVVIKLRPKEGVTDGGILLNPDIETRDPVAEVVSCGPKCEYVKPGDSVVYISKLFKCCNVEDEWYVGPEEGILGFKL